MSVKAATGAMLIIVSTFNTFCSQSGSAPSLNRRFHSVRTLCRTISRIPQIQALEVSARRRIRPSSRQIRRLSGLRVQAVSMLLRGDQRPGQASLIDSSADCPRGLS
ncbi:hypothetical protein P170DRAFT_6136 [Aspergillus steynii IBT 23096]|uniref:Uncharacterized protein n=1 Tax=Aspergillus steynii IBT 23096 TaxID=1392250 RepID=A0A2I2GM02_9EURO|nr:uncharacterized protein P170DRAFT_6136 [Aspergillus steynii IBT 23096]PLB53908.1 hypothetical protein P170DRAFT_6136 [Aspergillus steynii IBT 23096]